MNAKKAERRGPEEAPMPRQRKRSKKQLELPIIQAPDLKRNAAVIGKRFRQARLLAGMEQTVAARRLGYANSSALCKIETGESTAGRDMIICAAMLYAVSSDYLLGLSDYPERDPATVEQLAVMRHYRAILDESVLAATKRAIQFAGDSGALCAYLSDMIARCNDTFAAMLKATGLPADLSKAINQMVDDSNKAHEYLRRRKMLKAHAYLDDVEENQNYPLLLVMRHEPAEKVSG